MISFSIQQINELLDGQLMGNTDQMITGPEELGKAEASQISFIVTAKFARQWDSSQAGAAIVNDTIKLEPGKNCALIFVKNADLAMAKMLELFDPGPPQFDEDIHPRQLFTKRQQLVQEQRLEQDVI